MLDGNADGGWVGDYYPSHLSVYIIVMEYTGIKWREATTMTLLSLTITCTKATS